jgi:hypothetical protein
MDCASLCSQACQNGCDAGCAVDCPVGIDQAQGRALLYQAMAQGLAGSSTSMGFAIRGS